MNAPYRIRMRSPELLGRLLDGLLELGQVALPLRDLLLRVGVGLRASAAGPPLVAQFVKYLPFGPLLELLGHHHFTYFWGPGSLFWHGRTSLRGDFGLLQRSYTAGLGSS